MAVPAVVWRNPKSIKRRRLWNKARRDETSTIFIVVRSGDRETEWEGLPNLEMIEGSGAKQVERQSARSGLQGSSSSRRESTSAY